MYSISRSISRSGICLGVSAALHLAAGYSSGLFSDFDFSLPVNSLPAVMVDIADPSSTAAAGKGYKNHPVSAIAETAPDLPLPTSTHTAMPESLTADSSPDFMSSPVPVSPAEPASETTVQQPVAGSGSRPLGTAGTFLVSSYEKLTYRLSMYGVPIGDAELEARNDRGETVISLRIRSNQAFSEIYPVNDMVETRHVSGRFIMVKIVQQEGGFRNDESFTINLPKKRVSWQDNRDGRNGRIILPDGAPLDSLSGVYSLRNRNLRTDSIETLQIFDSGVLASVPVEVLRREELLLPDFSRVNALVVRFQPKTAGMFRQSGDVMIWLSDDAFKVPLRMVTSIPYGSVTAELVSASSEVPSPR